MYVVTDGIISGNFVKNPQFIFSLSDPDPYDAKTRCPVVVSLAQKVTQRKQEHAIGFKIYQVTKSFRRQKEISAEIDIRQFFNCLNYMS